MNLSPFRTLPWSLALLLTIPLSPVYAKKQVAPPDHWVATWATGAVASPIAEARARPGEFVPGSAEMTLRQVVHTSLAGPLVRIELTNALGTDPLTLGPIHIALADPKGGATSGDISLFTANALTFGGSSGTITIPAGGEAISDPVALTLPAGADLVITMLVPQQPVSVITGHPDAYQSAFFAPGDLVSQRSLPAPTTVSHWYFLKSVDVQTPAETGTVVAFGDSITDGYASTPNTNRRWPDDLARRLQAAKPTSGLAIANEGISGNRILHDQRGPSALARFDREVIQVPGVRSVILLEGINDIGVGYSPNDPHDVVTAADLEAGLTQLAAQAHARNIKVIGATLTPYMGARYSSPAGEQVREALNDWIRTAPVFDGVIDFDKATRSPANPEVFEPAYDHGDHLHPSDAGMKAMADAIDLRLFAEGSSK
jgi:lysophospholipase L1-like esterase